jgi:hypothetical protein
MNDDGVKVLGFLAFMVMACSLGAGMGGCIEQRNTDSLKAEAVETGHAQYDTKTGKWQWKKQEECK